MPDINTNLQYLKGVGPARVEILNKLGLFTIEDIIEYFPRTYEDRGVYKKISELIDGETATFRAVISSSLNENRVRRNMTIIKAIAKDETGTVILTWFNQPYIKNQLKVGEEYTFYGKIKNTLGRIEVQSPVFEDINKIKNIG